MLASNPYLNFNGNCEEAFTFYKSVFGGELESMMRFSEMPDAPEMPEEAKNMIMHATLKISDNVMLMGADSPRGMGKEVVHGNGTYTMLSCESEEEINKVYKALSEGGEIDMPLEKTFWGSIFAMFKDKYGIAWMINYQLEEEKK